MEQDLIEYKNENIGINGYFKLEYKNQDVKNKPEFKKWYKNTKEYINKENLKRGKDFIKKTYRDINDDRILTIGFCMKCMSYIVCSINIFSYCYAECNICKKVFCIGCSKELNDLFYEHVNSSICLKGYLKALYLRIIYRRSAISKTNVCYFIMHIILCLFMTPLYLGFLSNAFGLMAHPNKNRKNEINEDLILYQVIYSILRGVLIFPYMILFFPFMVILLLPGIFSYRYYLYIYNAYVTSLMSGPYSLKNVGDN